MRNKLKILAVSAVAVMLLASCQSKEPAAQSAVAPLKNAQVTPPPSPNVQVKPDEAAQAKPEAPKLRNPFSNYMLNAKAKAAQNGKRTKGPLECCELNVFRLIAVVNAKDSSFGLVLTPDGKRYFVHAGDMMGTRDGKVIKLESRSMTVREYTYDEFGKLTGHNDTPIRMPEESGLKPK